MGKGMQIYLWCTTGAADLACFKWFVVKLF